MKDITNHLQQIKIIPVVVIKDISKVIPLARALNYSGLPCAEVTFRSEIAAETIEIMEREYPNMLLGAGTVLTKDQVDLAINSGASFIVSPGLNPEIVRYCIEKNIYIVPGIATPGELEQAWNLGLRIVKFFPSELLGGLPMIDRKSVV